VNGKAWLWAALAPSPAARVPWQKSRRLRRHKPSRRRPLRSRPARVRRSPASVKRELVSRGPHSPDIPAGDVRVVLFGKNPV